MTQRLFRRLLDDVPLRLSLTALAITLPLNVATSWLGAAYQHTLGNGDFVDLAWQFLLYTFVSAFLVGSAVIVPLERWLIRDRAVHSPRWRVARALLYPAAGIPIGFAILASLRAVVGVQDQAIESAYFIHAVVYSAAVALGYTFIEQAAEDVKRREAELQVQIEQLRIEIDEMKRDRQVKEITETPYFEDLRSRARELKETE